jgi:uncharacterized membrane protein YkoI
MRKIWASGVLAAFISASVGLVAAQQAATKPTAQKPAAKAAKVEKQDDEKNEQEDAKGYTIKVQLPAPVSAAFKKSYPGATIRGTAKETENGRTVYEVESLDKGKARDVIYSADGQAIEIEEVIDAAALPAPVTAAVKKMYPAATIVTAEKMTRGTTVEYELALEGAARKSVAFRPDGTMVTPDKK